MHPRSPFLLLLLLGCGPVNLGDNPAYYDEGGTPPTLSGVTPDDETGNVGGQTLTIQGSNFGDDPSQVMVVFNGRNAEILSVSDTEIVVVAPHGPIEGGPVDVTVGTLDGQATLEDGYTYTVDDVTSGQTAYVMISELSFSGDYLLDGGAELYEIAYPRVHTPLVGYWGAADTAGEWKFEIPDTALYAEWVDDLRVDIGDRLVLEIPSADRLNKADRNICYRPDYDFTYLGGTEGGVSFDRLTVNGRLSDGLDCDGPGELQYDRSKLEFCKAPSTTVRDPRYVLDWPVTDSEGFSIDPIAAVTQDKEILEDAATEVVLDLDPSDDQDGVTLFLPERFSARGTKGFTVSEDDAEQQALWGGYGVNTCFDDNKDGRATLDETALRWEWLPTEEDEEALLAAAQAANPNGVVEDVRVYVSASVIYGAFSWLGLEGYSARASIEVPDSAGALEMPAWVLYEFPTIDASFGGTRLSSSAGVNYAYLLLSLARVVEYRVNTEQGEVVFAFVNAELGASGWDHPLDQDGCGDCQDNDGDGWADDEDPDCNRDGTEELGFGDSTCNDGLDNDEDGEIDGADSTCEDANDGEDNCSDGRDNDRDGFTDEEDCECIAGLSEDGGTVDISCCDEVDDDADGWIDRADPDCEDGQEELGFGEDVCNNGLDDDGNGDIDALDPFCLEAGADSSKEAPNPREGCDDGEDNDLDGYTDQNDPGCEYPSYDAEDTEPTSSGGLVLTCYDGLDNDEDTLIDALDPDCTLADGTPNGFQAESESF